MDAHAVQAAGDANRAALTAKQAALPPSARVRPTPQPKAKKELAPPAGKGGPLWQRFYEAAKAEGHPEPERLADAQLRLRESTLAIVAKQHKLLRTDKVPKPAETVVAAKPKTVRVTHPSLLCKATCLNGNPCKHRATQGNYCSKHAP